MNIIKITKLAKLFAKLSLAELPIERTPDWKRHLAEATHSPEDLIEYANSEDPEVRQEVAHNKYSPPEALDMLAEDEDLYIRISVTQHPSTSQDTLNRLTNDSRNLIADMAKKSLSERNEESPSPGTSEYLADNPLSE